LATSGATLVATAVLAGAGSSTKAAPFADATGTGICILQEVQRIVFPARVFGTSNAA
jgi:hypothetical protein